MGGSISELLKRVHQLNGEQTEKTIEAIDKIIAEDDRNDSNAASFPHCGCSAFVRNGVKSGKQRYKCKGCDTSFVFTANTGLQNSHYGEAVWKHVVHDTPEGVSLDDTAESVGISHATAFNIRHKILSTSETHKVQNPTLLVGVCEVDDTYVLESYKGAKLPDDFRREPRRQVRSPENAAFRASTSVFRQGS